MVTSRLKSSTQNLCQNLHIPYSTVWKSLRYYLNNHVYNIQNVHEHDPENYAAGKAMCNDLQEAMDNENIVWVMCLCICLHIFF